MKIMHVIVGLDSGGAERMMSRLIIHMPNHSHTVVSLTDNGMVGQELIEMGYQVHALHTKPLLIWSALFQLWSLIRKDPPDIIQTWMYHADLLGGCIGRLAGVKNIVWNIRNTKIPQRSFSITWLVIRLCAFLSSVIPRSIICCSHAGFKSHILLGYDAKRMVTIPNGYDIENWPLPTKSKTEVRELYQLPVDKFIVGFVGRYDPLKGCDIFIKAAAIMAHLSRVQPLFLMIGRNLDSRNKELCSLILNDGGKAEFVLMGECKEVSQIMCVLDAFCLASKAEGFPNVVAEAMLMQIPCVVTDVGDAAMILGKTGAVVQPCNPHELAQALLDYHSMNPADLRKKGLAARNRIVENFDINFVVKCYEDVYK